jgi:transcriptional regulator GlxA family with amidase domain
MHKVVVLAVEGFVLFDLAIASDIFAMARNEAGENLYEVSICGDSDLIEGNLLSLQIRNSIELLTQAETIIIPGINIDNLPDYNILDALRNAASRGARIASICTGAFVLAEAGLLDGLRATTHWRAANILAERYPNIQVEPDVLFIDNGQILTSAGVASGVDLCLHMITFDYGAVAAGDVAADIVMPIARSGFQAQYLKRSNPEDDFELNRIQLWLMEHLSQNIKIEQLAVQMHMSERTLNRKFREGLGTSPLQWITAARVQQAQRLLESTKLPIEAVAEATGFSSAGSFREHFFRLTGATPTAWRNTFRR